MMGKMWNLWHGCHKKSEGCLHNIPRSLQMKQAHRAGINTKP